MFAFPWESFPIAHREEPVSPKYRPQSARYLENILCTKAT